MTLMCRLGRKTTKQTNQPGEMFLVGIAVASCCLKAWVLSVFYTNLEQIQNCGCRKHNSVIGLLLPTVPTRFVLYLLPFLECVFFSFHLASNRNSIAFSINFGTILNALISEKMMLL